jgi:lipopolysaccharide export system permease protein
MKTLNRYLLRQNLVSLIYTLVFGVAIFILLDIFERLDNMLEANLDPWLGVTYFVAKMPLAISLIMPAVFVLSGVVQLSIMQRSRELRALEAGGISYGRLVIFFVVFGLFCGAAQLGFAQYLGVLGYQASNKIWQDDVRGKPIADKNLSNVWFREGRSFVRMGRAFPNRDYAEDIVVYRRAEESAQVVQVLNADTARTEAGVWTLTNVEVIDPQTFTTTRAETMSLDISQNLRALLAVNPKDDPLQLPFWKLHGVIERLQATGSNTGWLETVYHIQFAYAFSLVSMALLALTICSFRRSVYTNVLITIVVVFFFYSFSKVGEALGRSGAVAPFMGAWLPNIVILVVCGARLLWIGGPFRRQA